MRITVLGAGSWGTTLAILLSYNAHEVVLWAHRDEHARSLLEHRENRRLLPGIPIPEDVTITSDIEAAVHQTELIVSAVPAQFVRSVASNLTQRDFSNIVIVNVAKGIENDSLMTMSEVLVDVLPTVKRDNVVTLSGPSFAEEVARQVPTAVVASSSDLQTAKLTQRIFITPYFRVYSSNDIRGVELAGSVKNVIAIGAGIADGAGFGDNTKAAIMTRATVEIARLGQCLGAQPQTFAGLSGIGDLIVTCMSKHSRNRHVGEEIGKGRKLSDVLAEMEMVAEGVATTRSIHDLSRKHNVDLPISQAVYEILFEDKDPIIATSDLMTRDAKGEG
ncbi:MAG: NAD(P)H-dependent glycerol-3-phosphate dehydrogenase [Ignavibacteriae bacterium]|nr:NAD(P)H-dependent glycerol-3-phosphate dehydrogenase [Ignavibacteria bacterium]MBI3363632.1 NAD(P)H-dependent glycerol-3-phosphate dehydrogenase [Ignavibacteriota bacterium]